MGETSTRARLLPVSILAGPSRREFVRNIVSGNPKSRFGLLASSNQGLQITEGQLVVEPLATTIGSYGGSYDPRRIMAQISAGAEKAAVDHLMIECDSNTHPISFAALFLPEDGTAQSLSTIARLNSILLAAEAKAVLNSIVHGMQVPGVKSPCILADQIECADVVALDAQPSGRDFSLARAVISTLKPRTRILQGSRELMSSQLDTRASFDFKAALGGAGWQKLMEEQAKAQGSDQGVTTFVYRAYRPFHPEKFWNLIQKPFSGVFRAKGFFWLATRMNVAGGLNIAGSECHYSPAGQWWAAHAHGHQQDDAELPDRIKKEWVEPFGDRRQAIAFMGIDLDAARLSEQLDGCLLGESEMTSGESSWATLPDPFPTWAMTHDHECNDHDCCHQ